MFTLTHTNIFVCKISKKGFENIIRVVFYVHYICIHKGWYYKSGKIKMVISDQMIDAFELFFEFRRRVLDKKKNEKMVYDVSCFLALRSQFLYGTALTKPNLIGFICVVYLVMN